MRYTALLLIVLYTGLYGQEDSLALEKDIWHVEIDQLTVSQSLKANTSDELEILPGWQSQPDRLLDNQSSAYIKSYGLGSLATISLWGGNSSQTLITWEDIPVTNPMLGLTDLSLLTGFQNQSLSLNKGGVSASHGSGAITGVVDLHRSSENFENTNLWHIGGGMALGSFESEHYHADAAVNFGKARLEASGFMRQAENNFGYTLGSNDVINSNADIFSQGLLVNGDILLNPKHTITIDGWLQETEKGIPPTTTQTRSIARQYDLLQRFRLGWKAHHKNLKWKSAFAYLNEHNNFEDESILLDARNRFTRLWYDVEFQFNLGSWLATGKYEVNQVTGFSDNYLEGSQRLTVHSIYSNLKYLHNYWAINIGARNEWNSITNVPLIPSIGIEYNRTKWGINTKLSREFRSPTLNEIFWQPGGNPDLIPEQGWNQELHFYLKDLIPFISDINASIYHRRISDWILWAPVENSFIWRPFNVGLVRSYGVDIELNNQQRIGQHNLTTTLAYNYTRSENLNRLDLPRIEIGDQLIYTPRHQLRLNTSFTFKGWQADLNINHTGQVSGINEDLDDYTIATASLRKFLSEGMYDGNIYVELENLLNTEFRVIERRPMPGRYVTIGTRLSIHKNKSKKNE